MESKRGGGEPRLHSKQLSVKRRRQKRQPINVGTTRNDSSDVKFQNTVRDLIEGVEKKSDKLRRRRAREG